MLKNSIIHDNLSEIRNRGSPLLEPRVYHGGQWSHKVGGSFIKTARRAGREPPIFDKCGASRLMPDGEGREVALCFLTNCAIMTVKSGRSVPGTDKAAENIELIASENIVSKAVLLAASGVLTNKYAEGTIAHRYYGAATTPTRSRIWPSNARRLYSTPNT